MTAAESPQPADAPMPAEYEFAPEQERLIADLGGKMLIVGGAMLLVGLAGVAWQVYFWVKGHPYIELSSVVLLLAGGWAIPAARAFTKVARTRGRDITHLMRALEDLRRLFAILHAALLVAVFLLILLFIFQRPAGGG